MDKLYLVLAAVLLCEEEKVMKVVDVVGEENSIISESDAGDDLTQDGNSKVRELSKRSLFIVIKFIEVGTRESPLFEPSCVVYGTHELLAVLAISLPVPKPLVEVEEPVVRGASEEDVPDEDFSQDSVKSRFCIQEECKYWKL